MRCCKKKRHPALSRERSTESSLKLLAAQTLKIASINGLGDTEKLETELEDEIQWEESRHHASEIFARIRRRCDAVLHAKPMLLFIVLLNVIDCLLVIGELTLDFNHLSGRFLTRTKHTEEFLDKMKVMYYPQLNGIEGIFEDDLTQLLNNFLHSFVFWNVSSYSQSALAADCRPYVDYNASTPILPVNSSISSSNSSSNQSSNMLTTLLEFSAAPLQYMSPVDREHYDAVGVAHALHYASISILSFLLAETILKILCVGRRFVKKRMEVFDAVIIVVSFTLDVVFVEGLTNLNMEHYVIVLSFLLPWRVLRVLNSLIVAVMVQHRFHLKLLYKQKRNINRQLQESTDNVKTLEKQVELLKGLCSSNGVQDWQIKKAIGQSLSTSGRSGLKALTKLVFHAAESFAPLPGSGSQNNLNNNGAVLGCSSASLSTPSITIQTSGDVEQGEPSVSTDHVQVLRDESHVEDETTTSPASKPKRSSSLSSVGDSGLETRSRLDDDSPVDEVSPELSGEGEEEEEEEDRRRHGEEEERTEEEKKVSKEETGSENVTFCLPSPNAENDPCVNEATSVTRL